MMSIADEVSGILNELVQSCPTLKQLFIKPPHCQNPQIFGGFIRDLVILVSAGYFRGVAPIDYWDEVILKNRIKIDPNVKLVDRNKYMSFMEDIDISCAGPLSAEDEAPLIELDSNAFTSNAMTLMHYKVEVPVGRRGQFMSMDLCAYVKWRPSEADFTVNALAFTYVGSQTATLFNRSYLPQKWSVDAVIDHINQRLLITNYAWVANSYLAEKVESHNYSRFYYRVEKMIKRGYVVSSETAEKMSGVAEADLDEYVPPNIDRLCTMLVDLDSRNAALRVLLPTTST